MNATWKEPEILIVVVKLELFDKPLRAALAHPDFCLGKDGISSNG